MRLKQKILILALVVIASFGFFQTPVAADDPVATWNGFGLKYNGDTYVKIPRPNGFVGCDKSDGSSLDMYATLGQGTGSHIICIDDTDPSSAVFFWYPNATHTTTEITNAGDPDGSQTKTIKILAQTTPDQSGECSSSIDPGCTSDDPSANPDPDPDTTAPPLKDRLDCSGDDADSKCCGGVKTSIISGDLCGTNDGDLENNSVYKLLIGALNILTAAVGVAAVGGIGYGALLYTTAQNSPEQTKRAISIITNVVIGIVAYGLMYVLLNFLIPGGIFGA